MTLGSQKFYYDGRAGVEWGVSWSMVPSPILFESKTCLLLKLPTINSVRSFLPFGFQLFTIELLISEMCRTEF